MKNWTIRWRIVASFGVILALMVVVGVLDYVRLGRIEAETRNLQSETVLGLFHANAVNDAWQQGVLLTEREVLRPDDTQKTRLDAEVVRNRADLAKALADADAAISSPESQRALDAFKTVSTNFTRIQDDVLRAASNLAHRHDAIALASAELNAEADRGSAAIATIVAQSRTHGEESIGRTASDVSSAKASVITSVLAAVALGLFSGVGLLVAITRPLTSLTGVVEIMRRGDFSRRVDLTRRDEFGALGDGFNRMSDDLTTLVSQVKQSALKVSTSITEIAATSKEQQATATEVAATTTEIGATSREISATSKELVRTMHDVSTSAEQSATLAGTGQQGIAHMEETMRQVIEAAGSVNAKLATLNEKAGDISQVVTTITKVADQTNLLSLNAAIEAEKAGEYGRGFAVVATEIRRLADQTAVATYDIDRMVKAMQSAVSAGVMSMDKFSEEVRRGMAAVRDVGAQLGQVIGQVQALAPRFESVTEGMQAQATGAEQITEALTQLSEAARQTVESLRQSTIAMDDLNQVAHGLRAGVSRFTLAEQQDVFVSTSPAPPLGISGITSAARSGA